MQEPGLDRHGWETEWAALEEGMRDSPAEALSEVHDLVARMLEERGIDDAEDEIRSTFEAAAETTRLVEQGAEAVSLGDVAAALENYRLVYDTLIAERSAP
jgi:hypothetical protein